MLEFTHAVVRARRSERRGGRVLASLAAVLLVSTPQLTAAEVVKLATLEAQALRKRPQLAEQDANVREALAHVELARSAYAPSLALNGSLGIAPGHRLIEINDPEAGTLLVAGSAPLSSGGNAFKPLPRYGATLDARGTLYDFGRTGAAVDAALAQRRAAEAGAQHEAQAIVRDVRLGYVRWATAHALFGMAQQALLAAEQRSQQTAASIAEGARPSADQIAVQSQAALARIELDRAQANLELARLDLGFLAVTELAPEAEPQPDVLALGELPAAAAGADPVRRALHEQRTAADATARVHDHAFAPVLAADAQAGVQAQGEHVFPLYRVGINLSVPLLDGGAESANRAAAQARSQALRAQLEQYDRERVQLDKRSKLAEVQAQRRIALCEELVVLSRTRVAQLEEGYPLGAASLTDLADARGALQQARSELVLAQAQRAEARLGVALGAR